MPQTAVMPQTVRLPVTPVQGQPHPHPTSVRGLPTAPYAAVRGRQGSLLGLAMGTVLRAGLIGAGAYAGGVRNPKQLALGSLAASATLSGLLVAGNAYASSQRSR